VDRWAKFLLEVADTWEGSAQLEGKELGCEREDVQECWAHWEERQCGWWGGSGGHCVQRRRVGAAIVAVMWRFWYGI